MARKKKHEEHENHERWLVSYADFITLLFAFFVVMYSLSAINEGKFRVLAESLQAAFQSKQQRSPEPIPLGHTLQTQIVQSNLVQRAPNTHASQQPGMSPPIQLLAQAPSPANQGQDGAGGEAMREIAERVEKAMAPLIKKDLVTVKRYRYWLEVEIKTNILFPSGSALLDRQALPVLGEIAAILSPYPNRIQIEGHTDDRPIRNVVYPSNWELSTARAMSVVHMFARTGVKPDRLSAVGYGEYRPMNANDSEEARARNRRVILVVMADHGDVERFRQAASGVDPGTVAAETATPAVPPRPVAASTATTAAPETLAPSRVSEKPVVDRRKATPVAGHVATPPPSPRPVAPIQPIRPIPLGGATNTITPTGDNRHGG